MTLPASPNQVSLKDILEEKGITYSAGNILDISLRGLSSNSHNDYYDNVTTQYVNVTGTPDGSEPYAVSEFHGWSNVLATFDNVRGNTTGNPGIGVGSNGAGETTGSGPVSASGTARWYVYYANNGTDIKISSVPIAQGNDVGTGSDYYINNSGTTVNLGTGASDYPPAPAMQIKNIGSGYSVAVEVSGAPGTPSGTGVRSGSVTGSTAFGTFSVSSNTWTHANSTFGTLPTQTSAQLTAEASSPGANSYPLNCFVQYEIEANAGGDDPFQGVGSATPVFKFSFIKSGSTTYYIYVKADVSAEANSIF